MPDPLQAQADKLSRHAQSLFKLPALAWLEDIQQEISNPAIMLEQLLHEILNQHRENEVPYSSAPALREKNARTKAKAIQVPQAAFTNSCHRLPQTNAHVSRTGVKQSITEAFSPQQQAQSSTSVQQQVPHARSLPGHTQVRPQAKTEAFSPQQQAQSSTSVQQQVPHARSLLGPTQVRPSAKASATHSSSSSTRSSQSTQLLTELGDLQNLLHAVAQEQITDSSPTPAEQQQPTSNPNASTTKRATNHTSLNDDLPFIESLSGVKHDETTKNLSRHQASHNLLPTGNRQHTQTRTQTDEQDQNPVSTSEPPTLTSLMAHTANSAGTEAIRSNPVINDPPVSIVPPESSLPSTDTPPSAHMHPTHDEAATYARVLSELTTMDSAGQDLLLDQLLDRFEERQRENAMRALGFTGGQI